MLRHTFAHLPGIGVTTERKLWQAGFRCWDDVCGCAPDRLKGKLAAPDVRKDIDRSVTAYTERNWRFFDQSVPSLLKWRAYGDIGEAAHYVDIETTGYDNRITVIGIYDRNGFHAYVAGQNLKDAVPHLEQAPLVVTFNGQCFDLPVIRQNFPGIQFNHVHIDLMYPLRRMGFSGGLKRIERAMGLARSDATQDLSGLDAVYLWQAYRMGNAGALEKLIRYNEEDVRNLEPLMDRVFDVMATADRTSLNQSPQA